MNAGASDIPVTPSITKTRKRKWPLGRWAFRYFVVPVIGLIVYGLVSYYLDTTRSEEKISAIVTALDATDPGWRLEELEAARPEIPDDRNSARLSRDLAKLLKHPWPDKEFQERFSDLTPAELLDEGRMRLLEAELKRLEPARAIASPMADMPEGRYRLEWAYNLIDTMLPDQEQARRVAMLFHYELLYLANKGDMDGALRSARATVCVGRSLSDEPLLISQLVRVAIMNNAWRGVERVLSLGEAGEPELVALEKLLRDEERHNGYLAGLLGERAMRYIIYSRFAAGDLPVDPTAGPATWWDKANLFSRMHMKRNQPFMMENMNRWVEIARLPPHEQSAAEDILGVELKEMRQSAPLAVLLMPAANKVGQAWRRKTAQVAATRGLIAVERYRMKHGRWPAKLGDVVPEFLKEIPTDPFDGKPLKMAMAADGVIVYSVGVDGVDDGGKLDRKNPTAPGTDIGFQLWDKSKRARPASKAEEEQP